MKKSAKTAAVSPASTAAATVTATGFRQWLTTTHQGIAALVLFGFIVALRAPLLLYPGRFWGEDGMVFFQFAWTHTFFQALFATHQGYYSLAPNLAGILSSHVPLLWAPRLSSFCGLLVACAPAAVILFANIPGLGRPLYKAMAMAICLFVPANTEIYLNMANSHFILCAATGLILVSQHGGVIDRWAKWLFLTVAALTGVVSIFLTPFYYLQWWRERRKERLVQAVILTVGAVVQVIAMHIAAGQVERHFRFSPTYITGAFYAKLVLAPLSSLDTFRQHLEPMHAMVSAGLLPDWVWGTVILSGVVFALVCGWSRSWTAILLAASGLWVALLSVVGALDADLFSMMGYAPRYFYAPQVFCALAVLTAVTSARGLPLVLSGISIGWLTVFFCVGGSNFLYGPAMSPDIFTGPPWPQQVQRWEADPNAPLYIWPGYIKVELPKKN